MGHVDVAMSHDWPTSVPYYGNKEELLKSKPHFHDDVSMLICECVWVCVYMYVFVCTRACVCAYVRVYVHVCVCVRTLHNQIR